MKKIAKYVPLETLIAESDVITLHTNATEENHHLLNADAFAKMKMCIRDSLFLFRENSE